MFVGKDGEIFVTVGGGSLESDVRGRAPETSKNWRICLFFSLLVDDEASDIKFPCGAGVDVLPEPATTVRLAVVRRLQTVRKERRSGVVITQFSRYVFKKPVLAEDMTVVGGVIHRRILDWCRNVVHEKWFVLIGRVLGTSHGSPLMVPVRFWARRAVRSEIAEAGGL
jgi:xanthine/CO dehydrogenase XdhC/CoxF family maturation factor